jgi:glycerol-3-phosphate dehydrogenase
MGRDVIDAAVEHGGLAAPRSRTEHVEIVGATGFPERWADRERLAAKRGASVVGYERLLRRYGSLIDELDALEAGDGELGRPLAGAPGYLRSEVVYAATHEGARHLEDVISRRTRAVLDAPQRGRDALDEVAALLAGPLGWDTATARREVEEYRAQIEADAAAEHEPDDAAADAAVRRAAPRLPTP